MVESLLPPPPPPPHVCGRKQFGTVGLGLINTALRSRIANSDRARPFSAPNPLRATQNWQLTVTHTESPRCAIGGRALELLKGSSVDAALGPPPSPAYRSISEMGLKSTYFESPGTAFKGVARQIRWRRTGRPCWTLEADRKWRRIKSASKRRPARVSHLSNFDEAE